MGADYVAHGRDAEVTNPEPTARRPERDPAPSQRTFAVGAADDLLENEAENVARQVTSWLAADPSPIRRSPVPHQPTGETTRVRRATTVGAAGGTLDAASSSRIQRARGGGNALPTFQPGAPRIQRVQGATKSKPKAPKRKAPAPPAPTRKAPAPPAPTRKAPAPPAPTRQAPAPPGSAPPLPTAPRPKGPGASTATRPRSSGAAPPLPTGQVTAPPAKGTKKTVTGDTTTTERHGEFSEDLIDVDGDVTTKESRTQAGYGTKVASETEIFDGTTTTTDASMWQGFAGAERSAKVISEASDDVLKEAIEVMARVGVFGEAEASKAIKRGGFSAKMDGAASGKIGAEVYGSASVEVRGVIDGMTVLAAVGVQVGAQGSIAGQIAAGYGPLEARLKGRLEGFAGAMANASGSFDIGLIRGINIAGTVQAKAGAEGTAAVEAGVKVGEVDLSAELSATGFAGGKALGMGKIGLSMAGVELGGKASAFAGLETAFKGKAALTHKGKAVASAKGAVVVQVGIGGTIGGEFSFKNGKLVIEGEIAVALGIGGGIEFAATVDFKEIATAVVLIISDALKAKQAEINRKSPGEPRPICLDGDEVRDKAYTTVHRDFMAYGAKKDKQGAHGVKRERVQKIIDKHHLGALADDMLFIECDEGIRKALLDAYGPNLKDVIVQVGQIRAWVYDE